MARKNLSRREILKAGALAPLAGSMVSAVADSSKRPNFLLLFPDQLRFDWVGGSADNPLCTPNIDRLAKQGQQFSRVYCSSPICAPSRAGLVLGREYDQCGVPDNWTDLPRDLDNYLKSLSGAGYSVAACGKLDLSKGVRKVGIDGRLFMREWGFTELLNCGGKLDAVSSWRKSGVPAEPYMGYLASRGVDQLHATDIESRTPVGSSLEYQYSQVQATPLSDEDYCDNWIGRSGVEMLRAFPRDKPWHLIVNFTGPHHPMDITREMLRSVEGRRFRAPYRSRQLDAEMHNKIRANYAAMIENIDRWVGIYIDEVTRRGELENSYIVFASDHGEMLGDLDRWAKRTPYDPSVAVPLVIAGPRVVPARSSALVSLIDLSATLLDLAGIEQPSGMTARSLAPLLQGVSNTHREVIHSGVFNWRLVRDSRFKLIQGFDPGVEFLGSDYERSVSSKLVLFDLDEDPLESVDVSSRYPAVVARLSKHLPIRAAANAGGSSPQRRGY